MENNKNLKIIKILGCASLFFGCLSLTLLSSHKISLIITPAIAAIITGHIYRYISKKIKPNKDKILLRDFLNTLGIQIGWFILFFLIISAFIIYPMFKNG